MQSRLLVLVIATLVACKAKVAGDAWTTADYAAAGVPAPDHTWTTAELAKAVEVLARETETHADRLPLWHGKKSGDVFARLAERTPPPAGLSLPDQMQAHAMRYDAINRASKLYTKDLTNPARRELIELYGDLLEEAIEINDITDAFLATFAPDDPSLPARRAGVNQLNAGAGGLLLGGTMIASDATVAETDRVAMLRMLTPAARKLFLRVPAGDQSNIRSYVATISKESTGEVHTAAVELAVAINGK